MQDKDDLLLKIITYLCQNKSSFVLKKLREDNEYKSTSEYWSNKSINGWPDLLPKSEEKYVQWVHKKCGTEASWLITDPYLRSVIDCLTELENQSPIKLGSGDKQLSLENLKPRWHLYLDVESTYHNSEALLGTADFIIEF